MMQYVPNTLSEYKRPLPINPQPASKRRRPYIRAACNNCRSKKVACDGQRPKCQKCIKKGLSCSYVTLDAGETQTSALKRKVQELQDDLKDQFEFVYHLTTAPEDVVVGLLRHLRATKNPSLALCGISDSLTKRQRTSEHSLVRAVLPPSRFDFDVELATRHRNAYPILPPINTASISINDLFAPRRTPPDLTALVAGSTFSSQTLPPPLIRTQLPQPVGQERIQAGPIQPPSYVDERLCRLRIGYWTRVPVTDEFAANTISLYLQVDHSFLGFFDADLFVGDLVGHKSEFCSAFLVAALLFYACQLYTSVDLRSSAISNAFFSQAVTFWEAERSSDSLNNAIAIQIFSLGCVTQGKDRLSTQLLQEGRSMAEPIGLLGVPTSPMLENRFAAMSPKWKRAISHASWGIYTWLTLHTFFYEDEGILFPPIYPIPGTYGEGVSMLHGVQRLPDDLACHTKSTFAAFCELCAIGQEIAAVYYKCSEGPVATRVPMAFAESRYRKLLAWAESLPFDLVRNEYSKPDVLVLHIIFHVVILCIFQPFLDNSKDYPLRTFSSQDSSPPAVFAASMEQIKRMVILGRLNHPHALNPIHSSVGHVHLCSAMLVNRSDPDWKFYFMLCVAQYQDLYIRYPLFEHATQGILALAMVNDAISSSQARKIMEAFKSRGKHHTVTEEATALFTIDFDQALTNPASAKAHALVRKFEELTVCDELAKEPDFQLEQKLVW